MNTDPIADLLTRIRNAVSAHHQSVRVPYSKIKEGIVKILKEKKFVDDYEIEQETQFRFINIELNDEKRDLTLKRISKPGQRIYIKQTDLKAIKKGLGIVIVSTSKGLMTNTEARRENLGGELICEVF
jgi:small subunit ribosomal protein S8